MFGTPLANDRLPPELAPGGQFADLASRHRLSETSYPLAGRELTLVHPQSVDELLSDDDFNLDERIPYWAQVWPSAVVLAERLTRFDGHGKRLLELGCGVGYATLAAMLAGFEVLATDYYADALLFTRLNAILAGLPPPQVHLVDWRSPAPDGQRFEIVAGADILYERPYAELVAEMLSQSLVAGGMAVITDPSRPNAARFPHACASRGLAVSEVDRRPGPDDLPATIITYEIRR